MRMSASTRRRRSCGPLVVCAMWLVAVAAGHAAPGEPQRLAAPAAGIIIGAVTAGDTGRPLRRVRISLADTSQDVVVAIATTDLQGRFTFGSLPAGTFTLKAAKAGFLEVVYGQKRPGSGRAGTPIQLAAGQKIDDITLQMPRGGVISGVVTDEAGDPADGVPMRAFRFVLRNGVREATQAGTATTDDRGHYRIAALPPGEYIVSAAPRDELVQAAAMREAVNRRVQEAVRANPAEGKAMAERLATTGPTPEMPQDAYVPVFFPGTTQTTAAAPVTLDVSEERLGTDLQLQLVPIARVSGTVVSRAGRLPAGTSVWLVDQGAIPGAVTHRFGRVEPDGQFSFADVAPGQYSLTSSAVVQFRPAAASSSDEPRPASPVSTALWASTDLSANGQPISELVLSLDRDVPVSGKVVFDAPGASRISQLRVMASAVGPFPGEVPLAVTAVDADGDFTIPGVVPGRYRIELRSSLPGGAAIKSSVFDGRDTLDFPLEVKPGEPVENGVITVVPRLAEITGRVQNASGQPATGHTVIVFAADTQFWTPQSRRIQGVRPATDGRFTLKGLPAGEYRLVAVTDVESGQWFDPAFLRELVADSLSVTLAEGEQREQTLRVGR